MKEIQFYSSELGGEVTNASEKKGQPTYVCIVGNILVDISAEIREPIACLC